MKQYFLYLLTLVVLLTATIFSCAGGKANNKRNIIKSIQPSAKTSYSIGDKITFSFNASEKPDSVFLQIRADKPVKSLSGGSFVYRCGENDKIGENDYKITIFYKGVPYERSGKFLILPPKPELLNIAIKNTFPHDRTAYTQGLEFYEGKLYESSGEYGKSYIHIMEFPSMKTIKKVDLDKQYFAEGLTILNDKLYVLTWKENKAFVYDVNTLEKIGEFDYTTEGWGLTNDGEKLYLSDGSKYIYKINPTDFKVERKIEVLTDKGGVSDINELEWIDGKIYANVYGYDSILIIDPSTGKVEKVAYNSDLLKQSDKDSTTD
ncbi:MAG: glutaminyl-peptide cyclotransferase, partial [Rikenellaceae bacterium]